MNVHYRMPHKILHPSFLVFFLCCPAMFALLSPAQAQTVQVLAIGQYGGDGSGGDTSGNLIVYTSAPIGNGCPDFPGAAHYAPRLDIAANNPRRKEIQNLAMMALTFRLNLSISTNGKCLFYTSSNSAIATIANASHPSSWIQLSQ